MIDVLVLMGFETAAEIYNEGVALAKALGVPGVDSWRIDDPTASYYRFIGLILGKRDEAAAEFVKGRFLSTAEDEWLDKQAIEEYGVIVPAATPSEPTITLHNTGGGFYQIGPGDLTVKASAQNVTFHNTDEATLSAGIVHTFELVCDVDGSDGTVSADDIDTLVTTLGGVVVLSSTAAVGVDKPSPGAIRTQCLATLGALSPNGPPDAYEKVARDPDLTGVSDVLRARAIGDAPDNAVTVYVAGASGPVAGASVVAVQAALEKWATPICFTPTTVNSVAHSIPVTVTISGPNVPGDATAQITQKLLELFAETEISDGTDEVANSAIVTAVHEGVPDPRRKAVLTLPAGGASGVTVLAAGEVPVLGAVTVVVVP